MKINTKSDNLVIILPTYNRLVGLKRAIDSVLRNTKCSHELIVIDGGSTDGTIEYLKSRGDITSVFQGKLLGIPKACNEVWKNVDCKYTAAFADDEECLPGAFDLGIEILEKNPDIGMVGLKMKDLYGPKKTYAYNGGIFGPGILCMSHAIYPMKVLRSVGFLNEAYGYYRLDADLTASVLCVGKKVVMTKNLTTLHHREWAEDEKTLQGTKDRDNTKHGKKVLYEKFKFLESEIGFAQKIKKSVVSFASKAMYYKTLPEHPLFGFVQKDWEVIAKSPFVKIHDIFKNRNNPYYLTHEISQKMLQKKENPYRHLVGTV